jgi:hypothetical protein
VLSLRALEDVEKVSQPVGRNLKIDHPILEPHDGSASSTGWSEDGGVTDLVGGGGCERKSDATWELPFLKSNTIDGFLGSSNGSRSPWFRLSSTQCTCVYIQINMRTL